jgi:hypothetical protein
LGYQQRLQLHHLQCSNKGRSSKIAAGPVAVPEEAVPAIDCDMDEASIMK